MRSVNVKATNRRIRLRSPVRLIVGATLVAVAAAGCGQDATRAGGEDIVYGEATPIGEGTARTYVIREDGVPAELGIALDESALRGLPDHESAGGITMPDGLKTFPEVLALPANHGTPFDHAMLDWNPGGHEPHGIYTVPHFDFHFYTISVGEREAIDPRDARFAEMAAHLPPPEYVPAGYIVPDPNAVPQMGLHWLDPTSPELQGQEFDKTFIYGSWDGQLVFFEPMVTKSYIESRPDFEAPIATPRSYRTPGYYPTRYSVRWNEDAREYRIALTGLQDRR
jgi:hypothetical protein